MLTTFARIAKILKGLVEPRNWVEEAFGEISGGGGGGGGDVLIVHINRAPDGPTLDKTWQEIFDALQNKVVMIASGNATAGHVSQSYIYSASDVFDIQAGERVLKVTAGHFGDTETIDFVTNTVDGYPVGQP